LAWARRPPDRRGGDAAGRPSGKRGGRETAGTAGSALPAVRARGAQRLWSLPGTAEVRSSFAPAPSGAFSTAVEDRTLDRHHQSTPDRGGAASAQRPHTAGALVPTVQVSTVFSPQRLPF